MPVPNLNGVYTQDAYTDALTVVFPFARPAFTMHVSNAGVIYQLAYTLPANTRELIWESLEHQLLQTLNNFTDPQDEGLPPDAKFGGVRLRSAATGVPAIVTVI